MHFFSRSIVQALVHLSLKFIETQQWHHNTCKYTILQCLVYCKCMWQIKGTLYKSLETILPSVEGSRKQHIPAQLVAAAAPEKQWEGNGRIFNKPLWCQHKEDSYVKHKYWTARGKENGQRELTRPEPVRTKYHCVTFTGKLQMSLYSGLNCEILTILFWIQMVISNTAYLDYMGTLDEILQQPGNPCDWIYSTRHSNEKICGVCWYIRVFFIIVE